MEQNSYYYNHHPFSFYPNPNPNSNPILSSSTSTGDGVLRSPGSVRYAYPHHPPAAATGESYYYYGVGGDLVHQQYAPAEPFSYATISPLSPSLNCRKMNKVGTTRTYTDLEMKKCKVIQGGASADSVRVCKICNVVCNSDKVFASHVAGEKHALKVLGISPMAIKPKIIAHLKTLQSIKNQTQPTPTSAANKASKGLVSFVQSTYCEVCKINCNSQEVLNNHKTGKKHTRNMQKLQTSMTPKPAKVPEKSEVQKDASVKAAAQQPKALPTKKDLETKKQKVLNGGAAADAVRVCGLCNVVCNSESVFASHIEGQKHMSKLNKQQAAPV